MTDRYYLINEHIKFYFDIEHQFIEFKGIRESLEPKEAQILRYILENHQDGIIKSEAILDDNWEFWSDKKVLQKVLSTLRKKFKNIGVTENGFIASGSNYKINYAGVLVKAQEQKNKEKVALKSKLMQSAKMAFLWAMAGAVSLLIIIKFNEKPQFSIDNIIQATAISGVSVEPALSPDGNKLAFTHKKEGSSQIYLKERSNLSYRALTKDHNDQVPSWSPSGLQLAFQRFDRSVCEIRLIKFDTDYQQIGSDELLTQCSPHTHLSKMTWQSEDVLFYTDIPEGGTAFEVKQINVKTKKVDVYYTNNKRDDYSGSGPYFIVYNRKLKTLFGLESSNWVYSNIIKINDDNTEVAIRKVGDVLMSIDVFENHVIFKDLDNHLKSFSLDSPQQLFTVYKNPLKPIGYPTISADSNDIAIVSGSVYRNDIFAMNLQDKTIAEIKTSQSRLRTPQQAENEILFVSNETGIYQVYSYSNSIQTPLTNFTENKLIVNFTISLDKQWLAINFIDGTTLYRLHSNGLTAVKTYPLLSFPAFSNNSKRMLLKNLVETQEQGVTTWKQELIEYSLEDFNETGITIKNAIFGVYHERGIIYQGVDRAYNLFKLDGVSKLYQGTFRGTTAMFAANKNSMFISSPTETVQFDLNTGESVKLPPQIKGDITVSNTHIYFKSQSFSNMVIFKGKLISN